MDEDIEHHIDGDETIGVYYCGGGSKFLCFDVDDMEPVKTLGIIGTLRHIGISAQDIHVETSGKKGYHVWLFFSDTLPIRKLVAFGKWVINQMGEYRDRIELRPESAQSRGIKLPFALHRATQKRSQWMTHDLTAISDQWNYFLGIRQIDKQWMDHKIGECLNISNIRLRRNELSDVESVVHYVDADLSGIRPNTKLRQRAQRIYENGIGDEEVTQGWGRHQCQFIVALFLRDKSYGSDDIVDMVTEWAINEKRCGRATASETHIRRDIQRQVKQIFEGDLQLWDAMDRKVCEMTRSDLLFAAQFKRKTARKVMWALLIYGRMYHDNGVFYIDQRSLAATAQVSLQTVNTVIKRLIDENVIELRERGSYNTRRSNVYFIGQLLNDNGDIVAVNEDVGQLYTSTLKTVLTA